MKNKWKQSLTPYLFIAPHVVLFVAFFLIPMLYGLYASFTKWNLFNDPVWIGLENYKTILFNQDSTFYRQFWNGLNNTVLFVIFCVPLQIIIPLLLATALTKKPRGYAVFQSVFYLPTLLSISAVVLTWLFIFNRSLGLFNRVFGTDVNWYSEQPFAWITIVSVTLWWCIGSNMIIYVAAMSDVDKSLLEACEIDGGNSFQKFWRVILPCIRFPLMYTVLTSIISQFNIYGQPLMLNPNNIPIESVTVLLIYIRNLAFGTGTPIAGVASAMAVCLGLVIGVVSVGQTFIIKNQD